MNDKKKIGLVSVWNHNYGSLLQTYAMQKFLFMKQYDNEILNFSENGVLNKVSRLSNRFYRKAKFKTIVRKIIFLLKLRHYAHEMKIRAVVFENFKTNYLTFSNPILNRDELRRITKSYSKIVLGSDQVLHPANLEMNYFNLSFVPDDIIKIGYAPSFGVADIPKSQIVRTKKYLKRFNYLSVREKSGQKIVKDLVDLDVPVVCDPTILVEKETWLRLLENEDRYKQEYIFCYFLGDNDAHRSFAKKLSALTGYKIVALKFLDEYVKGDVDFGDESPFDVGPKEFVNYINGAKYVLTDSFHASIFSILFEKNFYCFTRFKSNKNSSTNSRIYNLLEQLNLKERLLLGDELPVNVLNNSINYVEVNSKIREIRESSTSYIEEALITK